MLARGPTMARACTKPQLVAALCLAALAPARAVARKPVHPPPAAPALPPNADQQEVVAAVVADTFPLPKQQPLRLALCLDVQIGPVVEAQAPVPRPRDARKPGRSPEPPPIAVRGAPAELVARLQRPWRTVASALACRVSPHEPVSFNDARRTPAQLVTVHLAPDVAVGAVKIDWTDARDPSAARSRDCTALREARGWTVRCGGTWSQ
jgi:hypothetical protein